LWPPLEGQLASARVHRMFFLGFSWNLGKLKSHNGSAKLALPMVGMLLLSWAAFGLTMFSDLSQIWLRRCTKIPCFSNPGSEFKLSSLQKYVFSHFTQLHVLDSVSHSRCFQRVIVVSRHSHPPRSSQSNDACPAGTWKPGQNSEKRWNSLYMIPVCGQLPMMYVYIYYHMQMQLYFIYIICNYMILCRILQVESYWIAKTPVWIISGISKAQIPLQLDHPSSWCQPSLSFWGLNHLVTWSGSNPQSYPFWGSFWRGIDVTISKNIPYGHQCPWLHMLHIYLGII
jgi:hypothetical protein